MLILRDLFNDIILNYKNNENLYSDTQKVIIINKQNLKMYSNLSY